MFRLNRNVDRLDIYHGLSDEGLWGIIKSERAATPVVYLYRPLDAAKVQMGWHGWLSRTAACM